jgi:hypothetical protein
MLKCWSILVSLKMMASYKSAISSLERMMVVPEAISPWPLGLASTNSEPRREELRDYVLYLSDPP